MLRILHLDEDVEGDHMYKVNINVIKLGGGVQTSIYLSSSYLFSSVHLFISLKLQYSGSAKLFYFSILRDWKEGTSHPGFTFPYFTGMNA